MRLICSALVLAVVASPAASQDTLVVRANQPPVWGESPQLVEELRLGTLDGPLEESFGQVTDVTPIADGLLVVDAYSTAVRRFDAEGHYLGDVGRTGSGPGEFYEIGGLRPHPDGLAIWDPRNGRVSIFDADGRFLRSIPHFTGLFTEEPFQVDTAGDFYLKVMAPDAEPRPGYPAKNVWVKLNPAGEAVDSIPIPVASRTPGFVLFTPTGPLYPFLVRTLAALSPHGYQVTGLNSAYNLYRPLPDGRVLRIERDFDPVPIGPEELTEWQALLDYARGLQNPNYDVEIPVISGDTKPAFRDLSVDLDGRIWVTRYTQARFVPERRPTQSSRPSINWREPPVWDVIDPRGTYLGTLRLPAGRLAAAAGMNVWTVETGEFDEEYVVQYRIELNPDSR